MGMKPRSRRGVTIAGYDELLALHRALMEAKFTDRASDPAVSGSTEVASLANRVIDELAALDPGGNWFQWRVATPWRREWRVCVERIGSAADWEHWSAEAKRDFSQRLFAPLTLDDTALERFLHDADAVMAARRASRSRVQHAVGDVIELMLSGRFAELAALTGGTRYDESSLRAAVGHHTLDAPEPDDIRVVAIPGQPRRWLVECDFGEPTLAMAIAEDDETGALIIELERFEVV